MGSARAPAGARCAPRQGRPAPAGPHSPRAWNAPPVSNCDRAGELFFIFNFFLIFFGGVVVVVGFGFILIFGALVLLGFFFLSPQFFFCINFFACKYLFFPFFFPPQNIFYMNYFFLHALIFFCINFFFLLPEDIFFPLKNPRVKSPRL